LVAAIRITPHWPRNRPFDQQLVQRLPASPQPPPRPRRDGADRTIVDEDDARRILLACRNVATRLAPTLTNISTKSEPRKKNAGFTGDRRAISVLPVPRAD
jgi:hypothetical protein